MFAKEQGIPPERIVSGGWLKDGDYEASERSDVGRWGEQARAAQRAASARNVSKVDPETGREIEQERYRGSGTERSYDPNDYMEGDKLPRDGGYFLHKNGDAEPAPTHLLTALKHVPATSSPSPEVAYMRESGAVRVGYNGSDYLSVEAKNALTAPQIKQIADMMKTHNRPVVYDLPSGSGEAETWLDFTRVANKSKVDLETNEGEVSP